MHSFCFLLQSEMEIFLFQIIRFSTTGCFKLIVNKIEKNHGVKDNSKHNIKRVKELSAGTECLRGEGGSGLELL